MAGMGLDNIMTEHLNETNKKHPLFSLIVLAYNNQKHIYDALDSIFAQDYPNIELIISDDGSNFFNEQELSSYVTERITSNITNYIFNRNKNNVGTVKHLELTREKCSGDFIMSIAADDALYSNNSISTLVKACTDNPEANVITSQVGMYDEELKRLHSLFVSSEDAVLINSGEPWKLFEELTSRCFIAASGTVYTKDIFNEIGILSDNYFIIEDWTTHLRLARKGIKIKFIDKITVKHRHGGISHGNKNNTSESYIRYCKDFVTAFDLEILPYIDKINPEQVDKIFERYNSHCDQYDTLNGELLRAKKLGISIKTLRNILSFKNILLNISSLDKIRTDALISIAIFTMLFAISSYNYSRIYYVYYNNWLINLGIFFAGITILRLLIYFVFNFWILLKYRTLRH